MQRRLPVLFPVTSIFFRVIDGKGGDFFGNWEDGEPIPPSLPGIAVQGTASLPLAYGPGNPSLFEEDGYAGQARA